jgi:hypothetical protein
VLARAAMRRVWGNVAIAFPRVQSLRSFSRKVAKNACVKLLAFSATHPAFIDHGSMSVRRGRLLQPSIAELASPMISLL